MYTLIRKSLIEMQSPYGFAGDGNDLPAGATAQSLVEQLGAAYRKVAAGRR